MPVLPSWALVIHLRSLKEYPRFDENWTSCVLMLSLIVAPKTLNPKPLNPKPQEELLGFLLGRNPRTVEFEPLREQPQPKGLQV